MSLSSNTKLQMIGISKSYSKKLVVKNIDIELRKGEVVGLFGPNGAGKTTCFYIATGLIKPDSGQIQFGQYDITDLPMYKRALMGIGYLAQEASIFRGLTVKENILSVLEIHEHLYDEQQARLYSLLQEFKISHLEYTKGYELSGGERRRVEIARVLAMNPQFIMLDEPLAGIDPIAINDIKETINHLKDKGIGILITDHNVRETLAIVDRAYVIGEGKILCSGKPDVIINDYNVRRLYLGEEFTL